jgi:ribosome-binding protein aMBF1 (putative translation factor)
MADLVKLIRELLGPPTFLDIVGSIVFSQRMRQGLQQDELAEKANVDIKTIHRLEGGSSVETKELEKVLLALRLSLKDIGEAIIFLSRV